VTRHRPDILAENIELSRLEAPIYHLNHFEIFHPWEQQRLQRQMTDYSQCERILDVGSGTGNVLTKATAPVRVAVDLSAEMLGQLGRQDPAIMRVLGLAEDLPFASGAFDLVVTYSTLHHLTDWSALAELCRVARPGGFVLLDHEEAFKATGWRGATYRVVLAMLRGLAIAWYWQRPEAATYRRYRRTYWPFSGTVLRRIDFELTDGGHPVPAEIEAELARLGLSTRRRYYLLAPLPMTSWWQKVADRLCSLWRLGHFAIEATR
jgi:ubiquinone/menaquinone biosynthesis C-methylase UbiE